jgi:hypothetical protein
MDRLGREFSYKGKYIAYHVATGYRDNGAYLIQQVTDRDIGKPVTTDTEFLSIATANARFAELVGHIMQVELGVQS